MGYLPLLDLRRGRARCCVNSTAGSPAQPRRARHFVGRDRERGCCVCVSITPSSAARLAQLPLRQRQTPIFVGAWHAVKEDAYGHQPIIEQSLADHGTVLRYGLSDTPEHPAPVNQPRHVRAARPAVALQTPDEDQKARRRPR